MKVPRFVGKIDVADELNIAGITDAQTCFMCEPDVANTQRVEAHQLRSHGVDRHLVATGQNNVLDFGVHCARAGPIACGCSIHHGENTAVNLFLNREQIYESLVDPTMRVMAPSIQEAAKG